MIEAAYALLVGMLTVFLVLEGWDFGAGLLHFAVGRDEAGRGVVISALGPLWVWHEVWLVAFGGMTLAAFPAALASAFSGFYLALFLVLWCLIVRGVALEVRNHSTDPLWREAWDFAFATANVLLAVLVGVALGNLIRGVPLEADGTFSLPFFTGFGVRGRVGILDWYTLTCGLLSLTLFAAHGASFLAWKTLGAVHDRSVRLARLLWPLALLVLLAAAAETAVVRPAMLAAVLHRPLGWLGVLGVAGGGAGALLGQGPRREFAAFAGSCTLIAGLMVAAAAGVYPVLLHSTLVPDYSVTAAADATDRHGLILLFLWSPFALVLALTYFIFIYRNYRGKVRPPVDTHS
jgi:cytochrome d ubiquinol oxidase subunit II